MRRSQLLTRRLVPVVAALVVLALTVLAAAPAQQDRLPTELWEEYPLDPASGEEQPTEEAPPPATTVERPAVPQGEKWIQPSRESDSGGVPWLLALAITLGVSGALGILLGIVLARRRGLAPRRAGVAARRRLVAGAATAVSVGRRGVRSLVSLAAVPAGAVSEATSWRPGRGVVGRLRSEVGSLAPLVKPRSRSRPEPSAQTKRSREAARKKTKPVRPTGAPPEKEELPGISPPPHKRKRVASGLPPGKAANVAAEQSAVPAAPDRAEPQLEPEPAPQPVPQPHRQPAAHPVEERPPRRVAVPAAGGWEECEIDWWRGYVKSDFYALAVRPGGERYVAARSSTFHWWRTEPPLEESPGSEAHARLVARLVADGWEPVGRGLAWYKTRLRRRRRPTLRELAKTL
jgi:hypothetical protein